MRPDGSIVVADFCEEYIAHGQNYQGQIDPDSGRIYRLRGKGLPLEQDRNLESKTWIELVDMLEHDNLWHRQTAVRLLGERKPPRAIAQLKFALDMNELHPALEALWALHQMDALDPVTATSALKHPSPSVRAWAIRLSGDSGKLDDDFFEATLELAKTEPSAEVRCQMLSTAKRLPFHQANFLVREIITRPDDVDDPFIPLMAWHVIESFGDHAVAAINNDAVWKSPMARRHLTSRVMRRFAEAGSRADFLRCARLLDFAPTDTDRAALMAGFEQAFAGRSLPDLPDQLAAKLGKTSLSTRIRSGEPAAIEEGIGHLKAPAKDATKILAAVRAFGTTPHDNAEPLLRSIAANAEAGEELRRAAITSLGSYESPAIGTDLAKAYPDLPAGLQPAVRNLLASRAPWAVALLEAQSEGRIPAAHFDNELRSRLAKYEDDSITALLAKHFPDQEPASPNRADEIRAVLAARPGDPYAGEAIYTKRCASCHKLFFKGGAIGPDLTSYQRDDLSTMLISILEPNAEIREGYKNVLVNTKDGRLLSGFLADQDINRIVLRGFDGVDISIPRANIERTRSAGRSLMPEGLLDGLTDQELRDFFAYLRISQPISK